MDENFQTTYSVDRNEIAVQPSTYTTLVSRNTASQLPGPLIINHSTNLHLLATTPYFLVVLDMIDASDGSRTRRDSIEGSNAGQVVYTR